MKNRSGRPYSGGLDARSMFSSRKEVRNTLLCGWDRALPYGMAFSHFSFSDSDDARFSHNVIFVTSHMVQCPFDRVFDFLYPRARTWLIIVSEQY